MTDGGSIPAWSLAMLILALAAVATYAMDTPLGPWYIPMSGACAALSAAALTATVLRSRRGTKRKSGRDAAIVICLAVLLATGGMLWRSIENEADRRTSREATGNMDITVLGPPPGDRDITFTMAELERHRRDLAREWPPMQGAGRIRVELHPTLAQYQAATGSALYQGVVECLPRGPLLAMPVQEAPGLLGKHTPALRHEMLHASMCRSLGREAHNRIPIWVHEGIARGEERTGYARKLERWARSWSIFTGQQPVPGAELVCQHNPELDPGNAQAFYDISREFLLALEERNGSGTMRRVIEGTREGRSFEESLINHTGMGCNETYFRWRESW